MSERIYKEQMMDLLARMQKNIQQARIARQPALLSKPLTLLEYLLAGCQQNLSPARYAHYAEIFQGVQQALTQELQAADRFGLSEVCDLSVELLDFAAKEMAADDELDQAVRKKKEIVFLPYKASMWDSLESIWRAAAADTEHCNAYVVPIPYAERNPDGTDREWHCEIDKFPKDVPVIDYHTFDLEALHPDVIFIHNPYDNCNAATSVDSAYYSWNLKKYTDLLMYVPYYATAGALGDGQVMCSAYLYVDYIVVQSERVCKFFDPAVPADKLLPLGSPKFDRVLQICAQPPVPPEDWQAKMAGKTVYFYNTSLNGMLADTRRFLDKLRYVFQCFQGRQDACLLWRPHPLLETTFASMRQEYLVEFEGLKKQFIDEQIGIYDDTPDVDKTIAFSDVYIGDTGTSIISLFGLAGKQLFYMKNNITSLPKEDDCRGELIQGFTPAGADEWLVSRHNQLYHAADGHRYTYVCDLSVYTSETYYQTVIPFENRLYICPALARDILVIENERIVKRIPLKYDIVQLGAFAGAWQIGPYIFLIPFHYPAIVRCDMRSDRIDYITGHTEFFAKRMNAEWRIGGSCVWRDQLLLASPQDAYMLAVDSNSLAVQDIHLPIQGYGGSMVLAVDGDTVWMLPYGGSAVISWNPATGEKRAYSSWPDGFRCRKFPENILCADRPFSMAAFTEDKVILSPCWGNMFVALDKKTGEASEWKSPIKMSDEGKNGYYVMYSRGGFVRSMGRHVYRFFDAAQLKLYDIDIDTKNYKEVCLQAAQDELVGHAPGFSEIAEWLPYGCEETAINSLPKLLDGRLTGQPFDRERQLRAFQHINANSNGTCGETIYQFAMKEIEKRGCIHG